MTTTVAARPSTITGCMQTWSEKGTPNVLRSNMESLTVKVRRRTTAIITNIDCAVTLEAEVYDDFKNWYEVACQGGVLPTHIRRPNGGVEIVARFSSPPLIEWVGIAAEAFRATMTFEILPEYKYL